MAATNVATDLPNAEVNVFALSLTFDVGCITPVRYNADNEAAEMAMNGMICDVF